MKTSCLIVRRLDDGEYQHIRCHHDGHIDGGVGDILNTHYTDPATVDELFDLGDLVRLGKILTLGDTEAYHRDSGTDWEEVVPGDAKTIDGLPEEPFTYLFEDGVWRYRNESMRYFSPIPDKLTRRKLSMIADALKAAQQVPENPKQKEV